MLFLQYDFHASDQKMGSMTPPLKSGWGECVPQPMENNIGEQWRTMEKTTTAEAMLCDFPC